MEPRTPYELTRHRREMESEVEETAHILGAYENAEFEVTRIEPAFKAQNARGQRAWLVYLAPQRHICEKFGLAQELLLIVAPASIALARDIDGAERAMMRDHRLDRGFVFVVARDAEAASRLEATLLETGWQVAVLTFDDFDGPSDWRPLIQSYMIRALSSARLFLPGRPVWGWDFVGRRAELHRLRSLLMEGRPIGLYGLRKVGKTSLMMKFINESREMLSSGSDGALPVHVDMQSISPAERDQWGFWRRLLLAAHDGVAALGERAHQVRLPPEMADRQRILQLSSRDLTRVVAGLIERLVSWASSHGGRVILLLDEYERLYTDDFFPRKDGLLLLDYLRGQVQQSSGVFNICLAGVDRTWLDTPRFGQVVNPMFRFLVDFPLKGMGREDLGEIFHKLGRRSLLDFGHDAVDAIQRETGGHPFLARKLGDVIDRDIPFPSRSQAALITRDRVWLNRAVFRVEAAPDMGELAHVVSHIHPELPELLAYLELHPDDAADVETLIGPIHISRLVELGLLVPRPTGGVSLSMQCFGQWLVDNYAAMPSIRAVS